MAFDTSVGQADFATLRNLDCYYVDKTEFMYELVNKKNVVSLILSYFFSPQTFGF